MWNDLKVMRPDKGWFWLSRCDTGQGNLGAAGVWERAASVCGLWLPGVRFPKEHMAPEGPAPASTWASLDWGQNSKGGGVVVPVLGRRDRQGQAHHWEVINLDRDLATGLGWKEGHWGPRQSPKSGVGME